MNVRFNAFGEGDNWDWNNDDDNDFDYKYGIEYVMKEDGLYTLDGIPSNEESDWNKSSTQNNKYNEGSGNDQNYRYNGSNKIDSLKNIQEKQIQKMQAAVDSLKAAREKEVIRMKDSLEKAKEEIDHKIEKLDKETAIHSESFSPNSNENYSFIMNI